MWIHDYPPLHLGKGSRHQCPAVGESPPYHLESLQPRWTVGPLDLPDPELDLLFTSVSSTIFLPFHSLAFQPAAQTWVFPVANVGKSMEYLQKGKIHSGKKYAKYSGIVTTREMLTLFIPKGQAQQQSTGTEANGRKIASGHPIQSPSISSRCIAEW